jgi:hypothetical protein
VNCVVADAVIVEPVSGAVSLVSGKRTGIESVLSLVNDFERPNSQYFQGFRVKFPTHLNRVFPREIREFSGLIREI